MHHRPDLCLAFFNLLQPSLPHNRTCQLLPELSQPVKAAQFDNRVWQIASRLGPRRGTRRRADDVCADKVLDGGSEADAGTARGGEG
eukprot:946378-Pleurochrysis_carterae.AAC.1